MGETVDLGLEGGGVKGIALVRAISVLEAHGFAFARVAGTSAGAIVGSLVAAGMPAARLHSIMESERAATGGSVDSAGHLAGTTP